MKTSWLKHTIGDLAILLVVAGLVFSNGCKKTSPTAPETPNPPVPPAQALNMTGYVKDAATQSAISGASVKISKADNTVLATLSSGNDGSYTYDASSVTDSVLTVSATKDGYGFGNAKATIVKKSNLASVSDIILAKVVTASAPVTVASGGTVTTSSSQSVANQPLTVTVPPNAVSQNITLTAAALPAAQVPAPTTANAAVIAAGQFGPSGTVFQQPVKISFPLPVAQAPGTTFSLMQLNEQTGQYTNSGFTATVNADSTTASANVTHFTTYTLQGNVTVHATTGSPTTLSSDSVVLAEGSTSRFYGSTSTFIQTGSTGFSVEPSTASDYVSQALGISFISTGSRVSFNFPALPANFQSNGVQINPNVPGKGSWAYHWHKLQTSTPITGSVNGSGWIVNFTVTKKAWDDDATKTGWYWTSHDQGGVVSGPY